MKERRESRVSVEAPTAMSPATSSTAVMASSFLSLSLSLSLSRTRELLRVSRVMDVKGDEGRKRESGCGE